MYKKFQLNRTKIKGAIICQSEGGQVSLVFSVLYIDSILRFLSILFVFKRLGQIVGLFYCHESKMKESLIGMLSENCNY